MLAKFKYTFGQWHSLIVRHIESQIQKFYLHNFWLTNMLYWDEFSIFEVAFVLEKQICFEWSKLVSKFFEEFHRIKVWIFRINAEVFFEKVKEIDGMFFVKEVRLKFV